MSIVIGEYGSTTGAPVPGGPSEGGATPTTRVIDISGTWSDGVAPSTITVDIDGAFVDQFPDFIKPGTRKQIVGGDGDAFVVFNQLWVASSDNSEEVRARGITRITLQDARAFWTASDPFGPRAYNIDVFGESPVPDASGGSSGGAGQNRRYGAVFAGTAKEIAEEIFDYLGVRPGDLALSASSSASVAGFVDIDGGSSSRQHLYASDQVAGAIADDMPEFVAPVQMTAGEAMTKWLELYQLSIGLSPDDPRVGFVPRSDVPNLLQRLVDIVNSLPAPNGRPRRNISDGTERDPTPDILYIQGAKILIQGFFGFEPVLRDPDRSNAWLPLNAVETMLAYGLNMQKIAPWVTDGESCYRYAAFQAANNWPAVPPRLKQDAMMAGRIWREPQSTEPCFDAVRPSGAPVTVEEDGLTITLEGGAFEKQKVTRHVASAYRLLRDNRQSGVTKSPSAAGSRRIKDVSASTREAQPWRVTPAIPVTLKRRGGKAPSALPHESGEDFSTGKPRLYGVNAILRAPGSQSSGGASEEWVDLNFVDGYESADPAFAIAKEIGIEPRLIDENQLVWDLGLQIWGCNGKKGKPVKVEQYPVPAGFAGPPSPVGTPRDRSLLAELLDGKTSKGNHFSQVYESEELSKEGHPPCPIGMPFLWVQRSFAKASHNDKRDWTAGRSDAAAGSTGVDPAKDGRLTNSAFAGIGTLPAPAEPRQYKVQVMTHTMPDLQLRCETVQQSNAFIRDGGWRSAQRTGQHLYFDVEFDVTGVLPGLGHYKPVTLAHYDQIRMRMKATVAALGDSIQDFRTHADAVRVVNADILGWFRRFFPGVAEYLQAPVGQVALSVSGPSSEASMRLVANARSWRPYVGSRVQRDFVQLAAQRAGTGAVGAAFGGSGGGGSVGGGLVAASSSSQTQHGGGAPSPQEAEAPYNRAGIGRTPSTISDRRDPNSMKASGGRIDELFAESFGVQPASCAVRIKRHGPLLRIVIPGDRGEYLFDEVTDEAGVKYWSCLDGSAPFFPGAPDQYHPDVGESMGTILLPPEQFPLVNAPERGNKKMTGDVSILAPIVWHKRKHTAGNGENQGGTILRRKAKIGAVAGASATASVGTIVVSTGTTPATAPAPSLTPEQAAMDRHPDRTALEELELELIGGSGEEQIPIIEGPGWCPAVIFWHEQLQLDPEGNRLLPIEQPPGSPPPPVVGPGGTLVPAPPPQPEIPGLGVPHLRNMLEWLDYNPGSVTTSADDCKLDPITAFRRVNLRRLSYMCGIAANTEIAERMAEAIYIIDNNAAKAHRVALGASACACAIAKALLDDRQFAVDYPQITLKLRAVKCPCTPCGKPVKIEALGPPPDPPLEEPLEPGSPPPPVAGPGGLLGPAGP